MSQECVDKLLELEVMYREMRDISTGNPDKDQGFAECCDIVLSDLRSMIQDYQEYRLGPPNVPIGFKLHAVRH